MSIWTDDSQKTFWMDKILIRDSDGVVRINGQHYIMGEESDKFKGMGGCEHRIRLKKDGRIITTTNLWHQGEIPYALKEVLPDNASWVKTIEVTHG